MTVRTHFQSALLLTFLIASTAKAAQVEIKVKGLVCAFCAQALLKRASLNPKIAHADVSLEKGELTLDLKPQNQMSDREIAELVENAGFKTSSIARSERESASP